MRRLPVGTSIPESSGIDEDDDYPWPRDFTSETEPEDQCCEAMLSAVRSDDLPVMYDRATRSWGIVWQGDGSCQSIAYCPFCSAKLPDDLSDEWFTRLDKLGLEPETAPEDMRSDRWWKTAG